MAYPTSTKKSDSLRQPKLHIRGTILGYKRSRLNQHPNQVLIRIDGVQSREDTQFYMGKRIGYYYRTSAKKNGSNVRVVYGKVIAAHGNSGVVRAKFSNNLCADSFASAVRVFMYPSSI